MLINEEVKAVIEGSKILSLVTVGADGTPHPIIAGSGKVVGDTIVFGIYKMEVTQKNLASNKNAWILAGVMDNPKGYRLVGTANVNDKQLIFTPDLVESLM